MTPDWLTPTEIEDITCGLKQHAAQVRALRAMGFTVITRPDGSPLVGRDHFRRITGGADTTPTQHDHDAAARSFTLRSASGGNVLPMRRTPQ